MIYKKPSISQGKVRVTFRIPGSIWAEQISLVGDFNMWDSQNMPLRRNWQADWEAEVEVDSESEYRFRYVIDGERWCNDRHADTSVPSPGGGFDSVLVT